MKNVNGKIVRRLYLNQVVMAIFGVIVITSASFLMEGNVLVILASLLSIGLYAAVVYDAMWNAGAKDAAKTLRPEDAQLDKIKTPFYIALFASAFNIIGAVAYAVLWLAVYTRSLTEGALVLISDAVHLILNYANGIYSGVASMLFLHPLAGLTGEEIAAIRAIDGAPLITELTAPWFYFLTPIPLFITCIFAYYLGASEMKLSSLFAKFDTE